MVRNIPRMLKSSGLNGIVYCMKQLLTIAATKVFEIYTDCKIHSKLNFQKVGQTLRLMVSYFTNYLNHINCNIYVSPVKCIIWTVCSLASLDRLSQACYIVVDCDSN